MSFAAHLNGSIPISDAWAGYLAQAQEHLPSNSRLALIFFVNIPVIAILVNALWQVVCDP